MSLYTISVFSKSAKNNYQWLMDHLQKSDIGKWLHVCNVYGSKDHRLFNSEMLKCRFAILYHTQNQGRMNIAEVPDSLYYYELRALSRHLGKENVIVVVDDVMDSSSAEEERILQNQPSIDLLARDLFLFKEDEKDSEKLRKIRTIIRRRTGKNGDAEDDKPVFKHDEPQFQPIQKRNSTEGRFGLAKEIPGKPGLFGNGKPERNKDEQKKQQIQRKKFEEAAPLPQVQFVHKEEIQIDESCILGAGAFGTVHKGSYQGTAAAVKKILCAKGDFNDIFHEIQVSMGLHHPNIVKLMATTKTDTYILLANEYIHGDNLERILHNANSIVQISNEDKLYVGLEVMQAMQYIHSKNIIHQDIKPANILVEARTKKTLLTDWGMANIRIAICPDMYEKIGPSGGTVAYMAPECLMQGKPANKMSDMWSIGATVVELFTKQKPWTTYTEMFHNMFLKQVPRPLALMNLKQLPLLKSCFSYEPKQRPSAADMVVAIKNMEGVDLVKRYGYAW